MINQEQVAGAVWVDPTADFGDGQLRKKYFVLLNECVDPGFFILAITTSQARYPKETSAACGCPAESCFRIDQGQEACFNKITWIQFNNTYRVTHAEFQAAVTARKVKFVQNLDSNRTRSVLNCAKKSKDLSGKEKSLIQATLDAMVARSRQVSPDSQVSLAIKTHIFVHGSAGPVDLADLIRLMKASHSTLDPGKLRELILKIIHELHSEGLCEAGEMHSPFSPWIGKTDEIVKLIAECWELIEGNDGEVALRLTPLGKAQSPKYAK